ncbi:hypothetical protein Tco_0363596 [Tanacetum coccineum]
MEAHLALTQPTQVNKITTLCEIYSSAHDTQYCMEDPEQAFVEYASSRTDKAGEGLVSNFMASQDTRLSKFKAYFKQQQSEMTNKIDTVLKAITDRIAGALPSDTIEIETQQLEEPEPTLEEEFQDLHLNLSVLEVLSYAPIYNALLNKYMESLELGKNGSAFVQGEVSAKMEDLGLFTLPCRLGNSKPFDTLADLGSYVEVHIGKLKVLNDFYVIDMKKDPETPLLVGRGILATANIVIDHRKAKIAVGEGIAMSERISKSKRAKTSKNQQEMKRQVQERDMRKDIKAGSADNKRRKSMKTQLKSKDQ